MWGDRTDIHALPAEELCASRDDLQGEALASIHAVVLMAVAATSHMTGGLCCRGGAGGSWRETPGEVISIEEMECSIPLRAAELNS